MRRIAVILLVFSSLFSTAQVKPDSSSITRSDLDSLYIRTIHSRLDLMLSSGWKYFEVTQNTIRIKDRINVDVFRFLSDVELIRKSIHERKSVMIYRVAHRIISRDTVDINFGTVNVSGKRTFYFSHGRLILRKGSFSLSCGGTNGYIPTARYVYNRNEKIWERIEFIKPIRPSNRTKSD